MARPDAPSVERFCWPTSRLSEAFDALATHTGLPLRNEPLPAAPRLAHAEERRDAHLLVSLVEGWMRNATRARGVEVDDVTTTHGDLEAFLLGGGPALLLVTDAESPSLLLLVKARGRRVTLLDPRQRRVTVSAREVAEALTMCSAALASTSRLLFEQLRQGGAAGEALALSLSQKTLSGRSIGVAWMLRLPASAPLSTLLRHAGVGVDLAKAFVASLAQSALGLGAWLSLGSDAMAGRVDRGRIVGWALLLLSIVPLSALITQSQGVVALRLATVLKRRILSGCLAMQVDRVRALGSGTTLARIQEAEQLESLAVEPAFGMLTAFGNLLGAAVVLHDTRGGLVYEGLLVAWLAAACIGVALMHRLRRRTTALRLELTDDLIAKMTGHRTRLAQQPPERWHDGEDELVSRYVDASKSLDFAVSVLLSAPRAWLLVGVVALLPALAGPVATFSLIATVVGLLVAYEAMHSLVSGASTLSTFWLAWETSSELLLGGGVVDERPLAALPTVHDDRPAQTGPLVEVFDVVFRYRATGQPVLRGADLKILRGERVLLEGASGGGKTTLASVMAGLRTPESGLVMVAGYDQHTLNREAWRTVVATAPQYHENHIFSHTLAFNLLLGRQWPPTAADLEEVTAVCAELGLSTLIERMPAGVLQRVGETGWQLSQGEKSRIFIARALLQRAEVLILDESFGALDPETLELCATCVLRHARTLVVIAHP